MDKFKLRSSDFIGIIIPGVMLLSNLYLFFLISITPSTTLPELFKTLFNNSSITFKEDIIIFIFFIIITYIIGVILRLMSPDFPDKLSILFKRLQEYIKIGFNSITVQSKPETDNKQYPLFGLYENFPYYNWFLAYVSKSIPDAKNIESFLPSIKDNDGMPEKNRRFPLRIIAIVLLVFLLVAPFILHAGIYRIPLFLCAYGIVLLLCIVFFIKGRVSRQVNEYKPFSPDRMNTKHFFNYCKLYVCKNSNILAEEVYFAEGLSRMISGCFYAVIFSLFLILSFIFILPTFLNITPGNSYLVQIIINICLLLPITTGVHHVRVKESTTVFNAYVVIRSDSIKQPQGQANK